MVKILATLAFLIISSAANAASCFWVGGTGSVTPVNTASWSSATGGTASTCAATGGVPASSADTAIFDQNSGGGTVTLNFGGTWTVGSIQVGSFGGTWDNSVNNNNINIVGASFDNNGGGTRTIKLGTATYTISGSGATWATNVSGLTFQGASANIVFAGSSIQTVSLGNLTWGSLTINAMSGAQPRFNLGTSNGNPTVGTINIAAPNYIVLTNSSTVNITNAINWSGTASNPIGFISNSLGQLATLAVAANSTINFASFRDVAFTGAPVANNSFNLGNNSGITINGPSGGGGGSSNSFGQPGFK